MSDTYEYPAEVVQKWNEQNKAKDTRITTLLAVIEQCRWALDDAREFVQHVGHDCDCMQFNSGCTCGYKGVMNHLDAAIKKVKETQ